MIDCINIYNQPAFSNPLLKTHEHQVGFVIGVLPVNLFVSLTVHNHVHLEFQKEKINGRFCNDKSLIIFFETNISGVSYGDA